MKYAALVLAAATLAACNAAPPEKPPRVSAADAWCRPTQPQALATACYVTLTADAADRLVSVESEIAQRGEIHTMDMSGGIMRMRKLDDGLELPAAAPVALRPGAEHLMLIGPKAALAPGQTAVLTLGFAKAPQVKVTAQVRSPEPAASGGQMAH